MEASGTGSIPQDTERVAPSGDAVAGAAGTAAPAALTAEPLPVAEDAPGADGAQTRRGRPSGFGSRQSLILTVCCVAQFMVILDLSIVNVALPSIQSSLNFTSADLQWVVDAYAITFAGFLMLGGRAADQLGQRRVFVAALILFSITSLVGGAAVNRQMLVIARGVQGFSCAFMAASSLAIVTSSFPPGPKLHRAIGLWAAMNGLGGAAGTLFGGIITEAISWRWVLLINPPIGIATAIVAYAVVADRRRGQARRSFDIPGAVTLTLGQMVLVYGVVEAGLRGWHDTLALGPILAGLALLGAFCVIENRSSDPLIPFKELTKPLNVANGIVVLFSAALFPMWYLSSLYLQQVLGLSPLHAGLTFLPMALTIMFVARSAGKLVSRFGVRAVLGSGLLMMTAGMLLFTKIAASGSAIVYVILPGVLTAAGIGMSIVPSTIMATQGAKQGQQGLASGLVNTSRQVGGGLGIAVLITLATTLTSHLIGKGHAVLPALTDGFRLGYFIAAGLCAAAAVLTFTLVPKQAPTAEGPSRRRPTILIAAGGVIAAFVALAFAVGGSHGAPLGSYVTDDTYQYVSAPDLHPPIIRTTTPTKSSKLAPGYIFTANFYDLNHAPMRGQSGPLMLDNRLQPVWFRPVPLEDVAGNLNLQVYNGKPVLAWWQGTITTTGDTETGEDVVVDQHYRPVATLRATGGWVLTLHEILIRGHYAWVTANKNIPRNLSRYGGAYNGALIDSAVQEYDLRTGKLVYSWDALDHIPLSDSRATLPTNGFPWDAYHVNSINLSGDGTFVVSMRNTWAAYKVNIATGKIQWELGGRHSSFTIAKGADFQWQHDVVVYPGSLVTMFDDHCCQITGGGTYVNPTSYSRGLVLKLDQRTHSAQLAGEYTHGSNFNSEYMGSLEPLPNGNEFVGWGSAPFFTEYDSSGNMLLDARLPGHDLSYRATVEPWVGSPLYPPAGAARQTAGKTTVYASWNGATEVKSWRVLGGASSGAQARVASAAKSAFETAIPVAQGSKTFRVQALDAHGRVIGTSKPFGITTG